MCFGSGLQTKNLGKGILENLPNRVDELLNDMLKFCSFG